MCGQTLLDQNIIDFFDKSLKNEKLSDNIIDFFYKSLSEFFCFQKNYSENDTVGHAIYIDRVISQLNDDAFQENLHSIIGSFIKIEENDEFQEQWTSFTKELSHNTQSDGGWAGNYNNTIIIYQIYLIFRALQKEGNKDTNGESKSSTEIESNMSEEFTSDDNVKKIQTKAMQPF